MGRDKPGQYSSRSGPRWWATQAVYDVYVVVGVANCRCYCPAITNRGSQFNGGTYVRKRGCGYQVIAIAMDAIALQLFLALVTGQLQGNILVIGKPMVQVTLGRNACYK
jgi:Pyruvate/2-oxoacid:ferredoxin oxidoreductase delta subunit